MKSKTQHVDDYWDQRISKIVNSACRCAVKTNKQESRQHRIGGKIDERKQT